MNFKESQTEQKLRGGYYTPGYLADFLVNWVSGTHPERVLEPSCGDGAFLSQLSKDNPFVNVLGFELDAKEASKARRHAKNLGLKDVTIRSKDFLGWATAEIRNGTRKFDAVVGNPPFVRYQYLPAEFQENSRDIFRELGCKFTKHTNAWVPFVLSSISLLRPGGRLAMVVPAEIIHVTHAQSLRDYLGAQCSKIVIIDPEKLWFTGTLQGAVLLLAEKKKESGSHSKGLGVHRVKDREFVRINPERIFKDTPTINGKTLKGKWTHAFLDDRTRELIDSLVDRRLADRFDEIATVDVGIVTGANKYFLVDDQTVKKFGLKNWVHPMFGRSEHCPGIVYDSDQHSENAKKGNPTNFLWFKDSSILLNDSAQKYVKFGEKQELHTRYKCRIREPWFSVPSVYATEVGMLKRAHHSPRLILNRMGAFTTDTAYRIRAKAFTAEKLVFGFINALTALSAELEGRYYGGGVLELVPSEIERLLIPNLSGVDPKIDELDCNVRNLSMDDVLEIQSKSVLAKLGLSQNDCDVLLGGWKKLRDRRQRVES